MPHRNIPVFIPHMGCPHQCVFCNQRSISGCRTFDEAAAMEQLDRTVSGLAPGECPEIAFFGGSFTGIDRDLMCRLLDRAESYVKKGLAASIRLSTRPDYISDEILEILSGYTVRVIELGLQSMDDTVLQASRRGHTVLDGQNAIALIKQYGFTPVGQMMLGLPESDLDKEIATAKELIKLGVAAVRIYPTVVFEDTPLASLWREGRYQPLSNEEAAQRGALILQCFEKASIPCIRFGLCATEDLNDPETALAGPNHPALGEIAKSALYYEKILTAVKEAGLLGKSVILYVPADEASLCAGHNKMNRRKIEGETGTRIQKIVGERERKDIRVSSALPNKQTEEDGKCI